jgi:hypothetical protein
MLVISALNKNVDILMRSIDVTAWPSHGHSILAKDDSLV